MKDEYVWTCDYCGKEFKTKKQSDTHEQKCPKKDREITIKIKAPTRDTLFKFGSIIIVLYFLIYFVISSYAKGNGLPARDLMQPHKWFESMPTLTTIPTPTLVPSPTIIPTITPKPKIVCPVHINCKGQEFTLRSGKCSDYTCCQTSDNKFEILTVSKCNEVQKNSSTKLPANNPTENPANKTYKIPIMGVEMNCRGAGLEDIVTYQKLMTQYLKEYNETKSDVAYDKAAEYQVKYNEAVARYCTK
jgi:hypothetical protein